MAETLLGGQEHLERFARLPVVDSKLQFWILNHGLCDAINNEPARPVSRSVRASRSALSSDISHFYISGERISLGQIVLLELDVSDLPPKQKLFGRALAKGDADISPLDPQYPYSAGHPPSVPVFALRRIEADAKGFEQRLAHVGCFFRHTGGPFEQTQN
jgi:hypothetical protein